MIARPEPRAAKALFTVALFDFDGVIVESAEIKIRGFVDCFLSESPEILDAIRRFVTFRGGESRFDKFRYIYKSILHRPLPGAVLDELCERYTGVVLERVKHAPYVPGARELIEAIHRTTDCFVVSGTPEVEVRELIQDRGLAPMFKDVCGSPTPKGALTERLVRPYPRREDIVFLGDTITDYEAARQAGIEFLGVVRGFDPGGLPDDAAVTMDLMTYRSRFPA